MFSIHAVYAPFQPYFRKKRMKRFYELFKPSDETRIVDIGGTEHIWRFIPTRPRLLLTNIRGQVWTKGNIEAVDADGTAMPYDDMSFDVAYSNSVIEHVGDWSRIEKFAGEIRRLSPNYYVQTPYIYFPIEPHLYTAFIHMLPRKYYARLAYRFSFWKYAFDADRKRVADEIDKINLLNRKQMRALFPDATIEFEWFLFMPKSIIAYRRQQPVAGGVGT